MLEAGRNRGHSSSRYRHIAFMLGSVRKHCYYGLLRQVSKNQLFVVVCRRRQCLRI